MKITPTQGPIPQQVASTGAQTASQQAARARAIAMVSGTQPPVNQNNVSPEEVKTVQAPTPEPPVVAEATKVPEPQVAKPETEAKPEAKDSELSNKYQLLVRKEKALRAKALQQEQAIKAREDAIKAKETELAAKEQLFRDGFISKQKLKEDTLAALAEADVSYDEITQKHIERPQTDPATMTYIKKLEEKISKLETGVEETRKTYTSSQEQAYQAALKQIRTDVSNLVKTDPTYETIKATRSVNDVVELIERTFKEDGVLLSVEEAAQEVESYLVDEATRLAGLSKVRSRLTPAPAVQGSAKEQQPTQTKQPQPMKTLTNAAASTRKLSSRERAILAFKGETKS